MRGSRKTWWRRLAMLLAAGMISASGQVHGQAVIRVRPVEAIGVLPNGTLDATPPGIWDEEEEELGVPPDGKPQPRRVMISVSIEHWVFGSEVKLGTELLNSFLKQKLATLKVEYEGLNDQNLDKLALAGRGDIKHFRDKVEALKLKYPQNNIDNETLHELLAEVQLLRRQLQVDQLFGDRSLFAKALQAIVIKENLKPKYQAAVNAAVPNRDPGDAKEQRFLMLNAKLQNLKVQQRDAQARGLIIKAVPQNAPVFERDDEYFQTLIEAIAKTFDAEAPLRDEQKIPLKQMLRDASRRSEIPLKDPDVILSRLSDLSDDDYRKILDPRQFAGLTKQFAEAKSRLENRKR